VTCLPDPSGPGELTDNATSGRLGIRNSLARPDAGTRAQFHLRLAFAAPGEAKARSVLSTKLSLREDL
jgi:hypothetical protein